MFEAKEKEKLLPTDSKLYQNKLALDEFENFDPFEITDSKGLKVFKYPDFEPYFKVIYSLRVTDENGGFLPRQTECLKRDILKAAKHETFLELLYQKTPPKKEEYIALLEEKLLLELVNLVLEKELPLNQTLSRDEISLAKKTFKQMIENI